MTSAVISVGSNLGDRFATLQAAVASFRPWVSAVSPVYETPPWGPVPQSDYLNAIVMVDDPSADAADWLARAHAAEDAAGRTREVRWGPRTLDVDLTLPHPRAAQRAFVLVPWLDVDPSALLGGASVKLLVSELDPTEVAGVRPRPDLVLT